MSVTNPRERTRRTAYLTGVFAGWLGACILVGCTASNTIPRYYNIIAILFVGVAVACGSGLNRMRLTSTIVRVFEVGMSVPREPLDEAVQEEEHYI